MKNAFTNYKKFTLEHEAEINDLIDNVNKIKNINKHAYTFFSDIGNASPDSLLRKRFQLNIELLRALQTLKHSNNLIV